MFEPVLFFLILVSDQSLGASDSGTASCVNGSATFDRMLAGYRNEIQLAGLQYVTLEDSTSTHPLLGWFPISLSLGLSGGVLGPLDVISRENEALQCSEGITTSISSIIEYDNLTLTFNNMNAKFLFWEIEGKVTVNFKPCISTAFTNVGYLGTDCSMTFFVWEDSCDPNYYIDLPNHHTWTDTFVGFLVRRVFNSTPLPVNARNKIWNFVNAYLTKYWCFGFNRD